MIILLAISMTVALLSNIIKKYYMSKETKGFTPVLVYNAIVGMIAAIIISVWGGFYQVSSFTLCLGISFGVITALQLISNLKALQIGPMAYTILFSSFSTIIPTLSGVLFFNEKMQWAHIIGIALMLISFVFSVEKKDEKKTSFNWLMLCLVTFLCTGGIGVMQKVHQSSAYKNELDSFLVIAFLVSFLCSTVLALIFQKQEQTTLLNRKQNGKIDWLMLGIVAACGVCVAVNNKLNLYLSGVMDSAVLFPIVNGGGLVLTTLSAVLIFRERLSLKQWIGVVIGILSVIFLCNPFR